MPSSRQKFQTKMKLLSSMTTIPVEEKDQEDRLIEEIKEASLQTYGELKSELEDKLARKQESPIQYFLEGV